MTTLQCANVHPKANAHPHIAPDQRTLSRTLPAHYKEEARTLAAHCKNKPTLKAIASKVLRASLQCANVHAPMRAHPHISPEPRTLERTLSAHCENNPRTLAAHCPKNPSITYVKATPGICMICGVPLTENGGDCWHKAYHFSTKKKSCISSVALSWLKKNRVQLRRHGWTMAELYRRNLSRGIAWCSLWDMPGLTITIETGGCISFHFFTATGQKIKQTAWPKKYERKWRLKR